MATETQLETGRKMALELCKILAESIEGAGVMGTPSGPLYAMLMEFGIDLDSYGRIIAAMVSVGMIHRKGDMLYGAKYWNTI